jgi:hypothetical protein
MDERLDAPHPQLLERPADEQPDAARRHTAAARLRDELEPISPRSGSSGSGRRISHQPSKAVVAASTIARTSEPFVRSCRSATTPSPSGGSGIGSSMSVVL